MKLLFIIHNIALCGAERVLSIIVNELAERGHQVHILTDPKHVSYKLDNRITLIDAYQGIDINQKKGNLASAIRYIQLMAFQYRIIKHTLHDLKPDATISFMGMCIWQLFPFRKEFKIIISDHSAMDRNFTKKMDFERRCLPEYFNYQTVLTQADKLFLGENRSNVVVINDPLTFPVISISEYNELLSKRSRLLACGNIDRYHVKGLDNLIRAFSIVAKGHPDWKLDIAGEGSCEKINELKELANKSGIESQVEFLGFRSDMDELMKSHILFVHAPRSEGFGMVLTEAMACGCPVISFALSGPSEIIHNKVDGLLVDKQDINALALAINELMTDSNRRVVMGLNALESVNRFSVESVVDKWEALFRSENK